MVGSDISPAAQASVEQWPAMTTTKHTTRSHPHALWSAIALLAIAAADANASEALARKYGCLGCHAIATMLVGPAYRDVAAKYAGQADALQTLEKNIRQGGSGKWGDVPMPPQPQLSEADAHRLAAWIAGGAK